MNIINWIKNNRVTTVLISIIVIIISSFFINTPRYNPVEHMGGGGMGKLDFSGGAPMMGLRSDVNPLEQIATQERMFVSESNISLLVKNVKDTQEQIQNKVVNLGGYVVNANYVNPDISSTGSITLRISTDKVQALKAFLAENSVRIVSENISGYDVTDQYTDTQAKLDTLYKTKVIFENILAKAVNVDDILKVQQSILSTQDQIDSLKGSIKYLNETSKTMLITINLSTDELSLPYAPTDPWRPNVVFKTSVRSLLTDLRMIGSGVIWIVVYAVIYIPLIVVFVVVKKYLKSKKSRPSS